MATTKKRNVYKPEFKAKVALEAELQSKMHGF